MRKFLYFLSLLMIAGTLMSVTCDDDEFSPDPYDSNLILIYFGAYEMGWEDMETPHYVNLYYSFYMGLKEVTFSDYDAFCTDTGRTLPAADACGRGNCPVINVSWYDAIHYCNWKSDEAGLPRAYNYVGELLDYEGHVTTDITRVHGFRLPTEAEWEYAARNKGARAGDEYSGSATLDPVAWWWRNASGRNHLVGGKTPNELGIYDMTGNVAEWCNDWWALYPDTTVTNPIGRAPYPNGNAIVRGGDRMSFTGIPLSELYVSKRTTFVPARSASIVGFRITRTWFEE